MDKEKIKKIKIGILGGGISPERDISFLSAKEVYSSLKKQGFNVANIKVDTKDKNYLISLLKKEKIDLAFIALHGEFGEDGQIQAILEKAGICYTGSGKDSSFAAMDKISSKQIFLSGKISTPRFKLINPVEVEKIDLLWYNFPCVVKPSYCGSSLGVRIVRRKEDFKMAVLEAFKFSSHVLVEEFIEGREFTVGLLNDKPLEVVEIRPKCEFFDFSAKYEDDLVEFKAPAQLPQELAEKIKSLAVKAHKAVGCRDFSRVDIMVNKSQVPFVLEVNSIPGLTSHSLLPLSAKAAGISFDELCENMVKGAFLRYEKEN